MRYGWGKGGDDIRLMFRIRARSEVIGDVYTIRDIVHTWIAEEEAERCCIGCLVRREGQTIMK